MKEMEMNIHKLTKLEAKRNAVSVVLIGGIILLAIMFVYLDSTSFKFNTLDIEIMAIAGIIIIISGVPVAYWTTEINNYDYLYRGGVASSIHGMVANITNDKVVLPYGLFEANNSFREIYHNSVYGYLYRLPNASLPTMLRCLDAGLKEKYKLLKPQANLSGVDVKFVQEVDNAIASIKYKKNPDIDDIKFINLIDYSQDYYQNHKETLQYLRSMRNLIHGTSIVKDSDAQYAIARATEALNLLYKLPQTIDIKVKCKVCGKVHQEKVNSSGLYIGNKIRCECTNKELEKEQRQYVIDILPSRTEIL